MNLNAMRFLTALAIAAGAAMVPTARAGELVVVEARGVALKAGQVIDDSKPLTLREGQRVTLIAANGNTLKLRGPFDKAPAEATGEEGGADLREALSALLSQKQSRTSDVGVVRAGDAAETGLPPDPWLLDVSHPGSLCVRDGSPIVFWRPEAKPSAKLAVTATDKSWKVATTWPSGADRIAMPETFPNKTRATYVVEIDDFKSAVTLHLIPAAVATDQMRAAWMIEKGCEEQAAVLIDSLN